MWCPPQGVCDAHHTTTTTRIMWRPPQRSCGAHPTPISLRVHLLVLTLSPVTRSDIEQACRTLVVLRGVTWLQERLLRHCKVILRTFGPPAPGHVTPLASASPAMLSSPLFGPTSMVCTSCNMSCLVWTILVWYVSRLWREMEEGAILIYFVFLWFLLMFFRISWFKANYSDLFWCNWVKRSNWTSPQIIQTNQERSEKSNKPLELIQIHKHKPQTDLEPKKDTTARPLAS